MKVLHFGAGNIGRAFIGRTIFQSGYDLTFTDVNENLINSLNDCKNYKVKLVGYNYEKIIHVNNFRAIYLNSPDLLKIISNVGLITTAVGVSSLKKIAFILAEGIILKIKLKSIIPLNIIACENKTQASSFLKNLIYKIISLKYHQYLNKYIGFVDCSIDTIVPSTLSFEKNNLSLIAENFKEWIVNKKQFKGDIPKIIDMTRSDDLMSFIDRKILTLNTGHAIAAYLGWTKKYTTIYESIQDHDIKNIVQSAMEESGLTLIKKYNFDKKMHFFYIKNILTRFKNPFLIDNVERIARNPLQKLSENERLIKPLLSAKKYDLPYHNLTKGIAAALCYKNKNDLESIKMNDLIKTLGVEKTLNQISNLQLGSQEMNAIINAYISINAVYSEKFN